MRPTVTGVHQDAILQNISILYRNADYIADMVAPVIPVTFRSDNYYAFSRADEFRDVAEYRAPGTSSNRVGFGLSTDSYNCLEIAISTKLEDEVRANADRVLRLETAKTRFVTNKILLKYEILTEAKLMTTSNWANSATPSVLWDNWDSSTPITDIQTAIQTVESGHGLKANTIVMAKNVWEELMFHPQLVGRMSNDTTRILTLDFFKAMFGFDRVLIGGASKNTAKQGQTASYSPIWSKDVWIGNVNMMPALESASAIYTFAWDYSNSPGGELPGIGGVRRWRDENIHSDIIEAYRSFDQKIVGSDLGYVLEGVIS